VGSSPPHPNEGDDVVTTDASGPPAATRPPPGPQRSFRRTLEAENKSPRTIEAYTDAVRLLATYCQAHGKPLLVGEFRREHIQAFIADQLARWKPATAHNRYRGLHAFFQWAVAEGDLAANPMERMKPPQLPRSNRSRWWGRSAWFGSARRARVVTSPAAATAPSSCCWSTPACAGPSALA
jgi:hypothetical protein